MWLGLAFVIDGIDGPLARYVDIKERLPRFSGERLDLVIDYLTYVFVPVLAVLNAVSLPSAAAIPIGAGILLSSLYHFSDTASKADDNSFVGFPAIWNIVAFYLFVFQPAVWVAALACLACIGLTFVPLKWVHPMRVVSRRGITLVALAFWFIAAAAAVAAGFNMVPLWAKLVLLAVAAYALCLPFLADAKDAALPVKDVQSRAGCVHGDRNPLNSDHDSRCPPVRQTSLLRFVRKLSCKPHLRSA